MLSFYKITQAVVLATAFGLSVHFQPSLETPVMASVYHPEPPAELDGGSRFSGGEKQEQKSGSSDFSHDSDRV